MQIVRNLLFFLYILKSIINSKNNLEHNYLDL